jgi:hypothetical protein
MAAIAQAAISKLIQPPQPKEGVMSKHRNYGDLASFRGDEQAA